MKVKEIMKTSVISVKPNEEVGKVLKTMKRENINGMPIVDEEKHILGIIVKADIYRFLIDPGHYKSCPVDWLMTKKVIKVDIDENILDVAIRLRKNDIIAAPVLEDDIVVGIVSIEDIVDHYIRLNV